VPTTFRRYADEGLTSSEVARIVPEGHGETRLMGPQHRPVGHREERIHRAGPRRVPLHLSPVRVRIQQRRTIACSGPGRSSMNRNPCMDNRYAHPHIPSISHVSLPPLPPAVPVPVDLDGARQTGEAIRHWAREVLDGIQTTAGLRQLLEKLLAEVRRNRVEQVREIEPRWLRVDQACRYLGGMSDTWVRDLEKDAPRGLFRRVRGTVFIDRLMLDRVMEGDIELAGI